ncbi:RNB domain-containing ribonuclease [Thiococcus pfennigii]|uniref:RNB domain-containing ribonuclease n=1 Tax=Thiococcus pfennigii TaxID=1057 RepID=UPI001906E0BF|nr:RNB domain-containing ribonuclease [Thiococcus pfennigii]MBK1701760.1 exoribonuclease II [Thiococcus pfennigii]MBK1730277.1 exoribonuclease II [Thiococcus pfennigii]
MPHQQSIPQSDSLVLYKLYPARVVAIGEKIEIELEGGQKKRVRPKDIELLHPGPLRSLAELTPCRGEIEEAWSLLEGGETDLKELTELVFDCYTPAGCWAVWQHVAAGVHFTGSPAAIQVRTREAVERDRAEREAKAAAEADWRGFLERVRLARPAPEDRERLLEVERLALGQGERSRILQALGHQETPQNAHRALVDCGYWPGDYNPYPRRVGAVIEDPTLVVPALPEEARLDLTHLSAYAIDDEGNEDPDDALSLEQGPEGERLWVHVADVAALVSPAGELEREARARGANLYLPEGIVNMLPGEVTTRLGLGLQAVSPALSFGFRCGPSGEPIDLRVERTWIRVERLTYEAVEGRIEASPFAAMNAFLAPFRARREARQAASIDLPEVSVRVRDGRVLIRPLARLRSRALVTDAMLMAGEATATFCREQGIPIPYACQPAPNAPNGSEAPLDLAGMYAYRRKFKPTRLVREPEPHAGLGLPLYTRATSPLRRYSDLIVHQQLRAWLRGEAPLGADEVMLRVAEADTASALVRRAERLSNQHWKLVHLQAQRDWRGEGVVVEIDEHKCTVLIPELALETRVRVRHEAALNARVRLALREVDLPELGAIFATK